MLEDALVNELRNTLSDWDELQSRAALNQWVDKAKLDWLERKILDLCGRLDACAGR